MQPTHTLDRLARRAAINAHPGYLDGQPENNHPRDFTFYDAWFLPEGEPFSFEYLEAAIAETPDAVAAEAERIFSGWLSGLGLPAAPAGHFAALYLSEPDGWDGLAAAETDAVLRVLEGGYCVYEGDEAFWEIYPAGTTVDANRLEA